MLRLRPAWPVESRAGLSNLTIPGRESSQCCSVWVTQLISYQYQLCSWEPGRSAETRSRSVCQWGRQPLMGPSEVPFHVTSPTRAPKHQACYRLTRQGWHRCERNNNKRISRTVSKREPTTQRFPFWKQVCLSLSIYLFPTALTSPFPIRTLPSPSHPNPNLHFKYAIMCFLIRPARPATASPP